MIGRALQDIIVHKLTIKEVMEGKKKMADEGYNPMQKTLEDLQRENQHLKRDVQEAERINNSHKIANGKMNLLINNLQFENKKLKIKLQSWRSK